MYNIKKYLLGICIDFFKEKIIITFKIFNSVCKISNVQTLKSKIFEKQLILHF